MTIPTTSSTSILIADAEEEDLCEIVDIHNALVLRDKHTIPQRGFFLEDTNLENIVAHINRPDRVFLVGKTNGQVAAYLIAKKELEQLDSLQWIVPGTKGLLKQENHWHVDQVATAPAFARQGCARALYAELARRAQNGPLSCYVATHPYRNQVSLDFHFGLGFQVVARFEAQSFFGLADYKSVLLLRKVLNQP